MYKNRFTQHKRFRKTPQKSLPKHELLKVIQSTRETNLAESLPRGDNAENQVLEHPTFDSFALSVKLLENIKYKGYVSPTPIQDKVIPAILQGKDVTGIANTGTGKTAAFLIPLIEKVLHDKQEQILVIAPTRELAVQIKEELHSFTFGLGIRSILLIGGVSINRQKKEIKETPHFLIGTPGRMRDLIQQRSLSLGMFHTVVLDEADRMVDIGFINDITYFISLLPQDRQSLFFSATIDGKVRGILQQFVKDPVVISVKQQETAGTIEQDVIEVARDEKKIDKLHDLLAQEGFTKVLLFGRTKWGIQKLSNQLAERGFRVAAIHGNKSQNQRQRALSQLKRGEIQVLLATDVASRGLDIEDVSHVINYDMPDSIESYVHRIGRTGRANKSGKAITFVEK